MLVCQVFAGPRTTIASNQITVPEANRIRSFTHVHVDILLSEYDELLYILYGQCYLWQWNTGLTINYICFFAQLRKCSIEFRIGSQNKQPKQNWVFSIF